MNDDLEPDIIAWRSLRKSPIYKKIEMIIKDKDRGVTWLVYVEVKVDYPDNCGTASWVGNFK
jgi:hypothetical protein